MRHWNGRRRQDKHEKTPLRTATISHARYDKHAHYEEWLACLFDQTDPAWPYDPAFQEFAASESDIVTLISNVLQHAGTHLLVYSGGQQPVMVKSCFSAEGQALRS